LERTMHMLMQLMPTIEKKKKTKEKRKEKVACG
jgi:hypothetical protein